MSSYVYMKILESRPRRYDRGIAMLSFGQSEKARKRLVEENIKPGNRVLDIGCGTGTTAILAASKGAEVTGFDISAQMLDVAREKVESTSLGDRIELMEMGVSGMDRFADISFDVVISTLTFSELSLDEQAYVLGHAHRILRPGGVLAIADEARPKTAGKRLLHGIVRFPLLVVTFAVTQTTTHAVKGLTELVRSAGFHIETEERSMLGSFLYLVGRKDLRK
ncbi:MAG: class I SAM-dependent methyltransferase [Deltaproteobacteria bacterium]|nr:class I SAM-dependent methyltransferase [Deltaproteobacteria bacterium]